MIPRAYFDCQPSMIIEIRRNFKKNAPQQTDRANATMDYLELSMLSQ
jgi:hypothetical protein